MTSGKEPDLPEIPRLEDVATDLERLDERAFRFKYGDAFLIHYGPVEVLQRPARPQATVRDLDETTEVTGAGRGLPRGECLVFPVRTTGRGPYPSMITVGRSRNNDVILPEPSVSKFHAYFKEEDDRYYLQDAGSRNGTSIDAKIVASVKEGKAVEVQPGQEVRFGRVRLQFVRSLALRELAARVPRG